MRHVWGFLYVLSIHAFSMLISKAAGMDITLEFWLTNLVVTTIMGTAIWYALVDPARRGR